MAGYSALDDSSRQFNLNDRVLEIFVSYLANSAGDGLDAYLAIIKDAYFIKKGRRVTSKIDGELLRKFVEENIVEGNSLIACSYYKCFHELDEIVYKYFRKRCEIEGKNVFKRANRKSKSLSKKVHIALISSHKEDLEACIKMGDKIFIVDGIKLLLYNL